VVLKNKADGKLWLSNGHLETIMHQIKDAAISASDQYVKNKRLALLSAIIRNKINDLTVSNSSVASEKVKTRIVEVGPTWFETRHEQEEELTEEKKAYFAQERELILAKLQNL